MQKRAPQGLTTHQPIPREQQLFWDALPEDCSQAVELSTVTSQDVNETRKDVYLCKDMLPRAAGRKLSMLHAQRVCAHEPVSEASE